MLNSKDLKNYQVRTDLAIEVLETIDQEEGIITKEKIIDGFKVTKVEIKEEAIKSLNKKKGIYITIEFDNQIDLDCQAKLKNLFVKELKGLLKLSKIKDNDTCLIVGLGNDKATPDSLGPAVVERILVTNHLFELGNLENNLRPVSALSPGVMGQTGIETSELIFGVVKRIKPHFLIVIDALASNSITRINKTIQMTDSGIHPGSGVGNARLEISSNLLDIPVIAIGIPTVVDAVTIVSDTINYISSKLAYNKANLDNPLHKLISSSALNYLKDKHKPKLSIADKKRFMGIIGTLNDDQVKQLVYEVLSPIGYNMMVTPKDINFLIEKLSQLLGEGLNQALHRQINRS